MGSTSKPCYERRSVNDPFARGTRLFDAGKFFEAHEVWEERWRVATDQVERDLLQGLIQVAAAFHKLLVMKSTDAALRLLKARCVSGARQGDGPRLVSGTLARMREGSCCGPLRPCSDSHDGHVS
jgi:hypothetical protein